jgi:hypothetical protein
VLLKYLAELHVAIPLAARGFLLSVLDIIDMALETLRDRSTGRVEGVHR